MHKILIFGLLLLLIPVSGQAYDILTNSFYETLVRAHGWKCDVKFAFERRSSTARGIATEIQCEDGKVFYYTDLPLAGDKRSISICHKGKCKKIN